jgi:hypothetical protein
MSEKRKPIFIMLLRFSGKRTLKIELFNANDFEEKTKKTIYTYCQLWHRYRLRVNGKWFQGFHTWYEFRDILFRSIPKP